MTTLGGKPLNDSVVKNAMMRDLMLQAAKVADKAIVVQKNCLKKPDIWSSIIELERAFESFKLRVQAIKERGLL